MTRFDATTPEERRTLVADAAAAHRERESAFCTVEADVPPGEQDRLTGTENDARDEGATDDEGGADEEDAAGQATPAWVQYSDLEGQLNLDCTDEEYDRITGVLAEFPSFTVAEQASPEDAEGRNLRISARADAERIAEVVERLFVEGFDYDEGFRLWATAV